MARTNNRRRLLILLTALLLSFGLWLSQKLTFAEQEIDLGPTKLARTDPFLAAKRLLAHQGMDAETLHSFALLDDLQWQGRSLEPQDTLILVDSYKAIQNVRLSNLLAWAERGGKVIATTTNPFIGEGSGAQDPFLTRLGVKLVPRDRSAPEREDTTEADGEPEDGNDAAAEPGSDADSSADPTDKAPPAQHKNTCDTPEEIYLRQESLLADFSQGRQFYLSNTAALDVEAMDSEAEVRETLEGEIAAINLARFDWGLGQIFLNADTHLWTNSRIHCHDHAYLLWQLVNPEGKVWFLINQEAPSLWVVLWRASPVGMLSGLAAVLAWLWASAGRFGPLLTRQETARRSLADHLHASAMLLWRRQEHPYLIAQLRHKLHQQILLSCPAFAGWPRNEQIAHLHRLTHISEVELTRALFNQHIRAPQDFIATLASLQNLRKKL